MKKLCKIILIFSLVSFPAVRSLAQLTVFNVSSSEITDQGRLSAQQQFEIEDFIESSTTVTYGLGRNWEVGLNVLNLNYQVSRHHFEFNDTTTVTPFAPLILLNAQKVFELNKTLSIGIGALTGTNMTGHQNLVYYAYSNLLASAGTEDQYQFTAGPYLSNHKYLGDGSVYGLQMAFDAGIWYKRFHVIGDWISGAHSKGRLSLGFEIFVTRFLPLSVGWQRSNSDGSQAGVIQLTFLPQ